jgi:hypothetical protein
MIHYPQAPCAAQAARSVHLLALPVGSDETGAGCH